MDIQNHLLYITELAFKHNLCTKIRGVTAVWKNKIAYITTYFEGKLDEEDEDVISDAITEIAAHLPEGSIEESYVPIEDSALPKSAYWGYKKF